MAAIVLTFNMIAVIPASADPTLYECPGNNAHVWDRDQCPRIGSAPGQFPGSGGGGGRGGLLGLVDRLTGGLL